ncbi:MAG TPA: YhdP family protein, partial [Gammaproteobacteria bacterium]|nr:YhdP family protein [Gammaproteobacteria bacterium]
MSSPSESRPGISRLRKWTIGVAVAVLVIVAIAVGLFFLAATMLPRYHDKIQAEVSTTLGMPVEFSTVSLGWQGWGPAISFRNLRVKNARSGQTVLSARRVEFDFTLPALVHGTHALPSGIRLDAPSLGAVETADGKIRIPGLELQSSSGGPDLRSMLGLHLVIRDGEFRLRLAGAGQPLWRFAPLNLTIGGGRSHAIEFALGLPRQLGGATLHLDGTLDTPEVNIGNWRWSGTYDLPRLRLAPLDRFIPSQYPSVRGTLASSGSFRGSGMSLAAARGQLKGTKLAAGESSIAKLQTRFMLAAESGILLKLDDTILVEQRGGWKPGEVVIGRDAQGRLRANVEHLLLAALPPLTGFLPASLQALGERLHKMRPSGTIENIRFAFTPGGSDLDLAAKLNDVGSFAADGAPGFNHLSGRVSLRDGAGGLRIDSPGFTLRMPHIFPHPVPLDRAAGTIAIRYRSSGLNLATDKLAIIGAGGLAGVMRGKIAIPRSGPVTIEIAAKAASIAVVPARERYLPTGLMPRALGEWLRNDLDKGKITGATLAFVGRADKFPFTHGGGRFVVDFGFEGVTLTPGPHWEPLTNLHGEVHFRDAGMRADVAGGGIGGAKIVQATVHLPDLFHPRLAVQAKIAGDSSDFLAFLRASPIGGRLDALDDLAVRGPASADISLHLPIRDIRNFNLSGTLRLDGVTLRYAPLAYTLDDLGGTLNFDQSGPVSGDLQGEILGQPLAITLSRVPSGKRMQISVDGRAPVSVLSGLADYDFSRYAQGDVPFHARASIPLAASGGTFTARLQSDLRGLALSLPEPVGKSAATSVPFSADASLSDGALELTAIYGKVASACMSFALNGTAAAFRGADIVLGATACHAPAAGLTIRGGWPLLKLGPWFAELPKGKGSAGGGWNMPQALQVDLHFDRVEAFGEHFDNQTIRGRLAAHEIALEFSGDMLAGKLRIPLAPTNEDPIVATLTRAHFSMPGQHRVVVPPAGTAAGSAASAPAAASASPGRVAAKAAAPASAATATITSFRPDQIPPFVLRVTNLELGTAELHDVYIVARRITGGIAMDPIHVGGGALTLDGTMAWIHPPSGNSQGALHFVANVQHLGALLSGLGLGPVITGHGALSAGIAWHGLPGNSFAKDLLGRVSVDLRDGSISQVSPGAGRLLSLLNLANLPRYLVFNFHNLFGKGFPFSRIYGDYVIDRGIASSKGLRIESSVANIKLTGQVNIAAGTMDQRAEISPNYFGSLPVIAAIV